VISVGDAISIFGIVNNKIKISNSMVSVVQLGSKKTNQICSIGVINKSTNIKYIKGINILILKNNPYNKIVTYINKTGLNIRYDVKRVVQLFKSTGSKSDRMSYDIVDIKNIDVDGNIKLLPNGHKTIINFNQYTKLINDKNCDESDLIKFSSNIIQLEFNKKIKHLNTIRPQLEFYKNILINYTARYVIFHDQNLFGVLFDSGDIKWNRNILWNTKIDKIFSESSTMLSYLNTLQNNFSFYKIEKIGKW